MRHDLIVVGGGPVGAALARAVPGMRVALVASARPAPPAEAGYDPRIYLISPGNREFLGRLGVWQGLDPSRLCPVHAMQVFGDGPSARIEFDAYEAGVGELGWTVEDSRLQRAMWDGLDAQILAPTSCEGLAIEPQRATLRLAGGHRLEASLIVGADGALSFVRSAAGIGVVESGYPQSAVVANFACEKPHRNTAYQWFQGTRHGGAVLALLPLPGNLVSMVWSVPADAAARIARLDPEHLCREVEAASCGMLGTLRNAGTSASFPLRRLSAKALVAPRVALAGDAAHVIHPLAGQGLNLGLQDARELARVLSQREPVRDPGDLGLLRRYERSRAEPILAVDLMVDSLYQLFSAQGSLPAWLRNAGLNLADRVPVVKNTLMRHAMR